MDIKELNKRIKALAGKNVAVETTIQELGLECLRHLDSGNNGPINSLYGALRRPQVKSFVEWALSFGKVMRNTDKKTMAVMPLVFDKSRTTDIEAATAKPWFEFADEKAVATAKAFDFQQAMLSLIKKAAAAGIDHAKLVQAAALADIKPEKVPATVVTGEAAAKAVGEATV